MRGTKNFDILKVSSKVFGQINYFVWLYGTNYWLVKNFHIQKMKENEDVEMDVW